MSVCKGFLKSALKVVRNMKQGISMRTSELISIERNADSLTAEATSVTQEQLALEQDI